MRARLTGLALVAALAAAPARAFDCHTALTLALDASDSVDAQEAALQRAGVAAALRDPAVQAAIAPGPGAGVMLRVFEWADPGERIALLPWTPLTGGADAEAAAARIEAAAPAPLGGQTGLGDALGHAAAGFAAVAQCGRRIIDVSGDGPGNIGRSPASLRRAGAFDGLVINGLVIRHPSFDSAHPPGRDPLPYYRAQVLHGPGAFVEVIGGYEAYARAMRRKLLRELSASMAALP